MSDILYCCKINDNSGMADLAYELLSAMEHNFSTWDDRESMASYHTLYFDTPEEADTARQEVETNRSWWEECGWYPGAVECFEIKREDWAEVWKKFFNIQHVTDRLVIRPSWLEYQPKPGQVVVDLDPGMSFGTGQHATTSFCLRMIDRITGQPGMNSFLDAGTGSGILSIAARKLGFSPVEAFDNDPEAVKIAIENAEKNGFARADIEFKTADLTQFDRTAGTYDLVAANILGRVLLAHREAITRWVRPGGYLILAGILHEEFPEIQSAFEECGLVMEYCQSEKEWTGGFFHKNDN